MKCPTCGADVNTGVTPPVCPECGWQGEATLAVSSFQETQAEDVTLGIPTISAVESGEHTYLKEGVIRPPSRPGIVGTIGRFDILETLGSGAMGQVFLAREPMTDALVAVKLLRSELRGSPKIVKYFLAEAKHMYVMSHPHVLKVLEVSDAEQGPYFVMPYLKGGSLREKIRKSSAMPKGDLLDIMLPVARGLAYAHSRGIIHRDLKPDNILLGQGGEVRVADFGLVRTVFNDDLLDPEAKTAEGTPAYMSPGVAAGQVEDSRCDIYAFGAVLYELLTGTVPFTGRTPDKVLAAVLAGPPLPILSLSPDAPRDLVRVAEGAMARELRDRYATLTDVVADLERIEAGQKPIGPNAQRARRNVPLPARVAAGLVLAVGLAALVFWFRRGPDPSQDPLGAARHLVEAGKAAEAQEVLRGHLEDNPSDLEAWTTLGDAAMARNNTPGARTAYDRALRISPQHLPALQGIAEAFRQEGNSAAYTNMLVRIRSLDPDNAEVFEALMTQLVGVGHLNPARTTLRIWAEAHPDDPRVDHWTRQLETAVEAPSPMNPRTPGGAPPPGQRHFPQGPSGRPPQGPPPGRAPFSELESDTKPNLAVGESHEPSTPQS